MIKTSLVALSLVAGSSAGYAADNDGGRGFGHSSPSENRVDAPDLHGREEMIDPKSTGSIQSCETQSYDEFGNCIVDPKMQ